MTPSISLNGALTTAPVAGLGGFSGKPRRSRSALDRGRRSASWLSAGILARLLERDCRGLVVFPNRCVVCRKRETYFAIGLEDSEQFRVGHLLDAGREGVRSAFARGSRGLGGLSGCKSEEGENEEEGSDEHSLVFFF